MRYLLKASSHTRTPSLLQSSDQKNARHRQEKRNESRRILVIKHGALGDLMNATGAFSAIRTHHATDSLILLTDPAYCTLGKKMGFFRDVYPDPRPKNFFDLFRLRRWLRSQAYHRIYDLQNSQRTNLYFQLLLPGIRPEWSGVAWGCSHPQARLDRERIHTYERFADQLQVAGLRIQSPEEVYPDLSWLKEDISRFSLPPNSVLLIPGSSRSGSYKRWPAHFYGLLAQRFLKTGQITPVFIGGPEDQEAVQEAIKMCPEALNLHQQLSFLEIGVLAQKTLGVIGNDTGPTHLCAAAQVRTLALWSCASDPAVYGPQGSHVQILFESDLTNLRVERVERAFGSLLSAS